LSITRSELLSGGGITVTCLRSPSSAALAVRIFSARCLGCMTQAMRIAVRLLPGTRRAPRPLSRISRLQATHYDTSCRSVLHGLRTPGRTSPAAGSRAGTGTGDISCRASSKRGGAYGRATLAPRSDGVNDRGGRHDRGGRSGRNFFRVISPLFCRPGPRR